MAAKAHRVYRCLAFALFPLGYRRFFDGCHERHRKLDLVLFSGHALLALGFYLVFFLDVSGLEVVHVFV